MGKNCLSCHNVKEGTVLGAISIKIPLTRSFATIRSSSNLYLGVGNSLQSIVESVQKVRDQITQIATAVDEQSAASEEVAKNIEKTSAISKDMERMADDVMHEVNVLTKIAEELRSSTAGFKTKETA